MDAIAVVQCRDVVSEIGDESDQMARTVENWGRHIALTALEVLREAGESVASIARRLCLSMRTLQRWAKQLDQGWLKPKLLGRPRKGIEEEDCESIESWLERTRGRIGVECLKQKHPQVARSEIRAVKQIWIREHSRSKRRAQALLQWRMPGVAWTMDFTKPKQRMQGSNKRVLVVRDLASGYTLAGDPCQGERAQATVKTLQRVFEEEGPPLVIKHDNGSAFRSTEVQELLSEANVASLPSPPGLPQYNGAVESGMGPLKDYALASADSHGHPNLLTPVDLERAVDVWNELEVQREGDWQTRTALYRKRPSTLERRRRRLMRDYEARFDATAKELGLDPSAPLEWWEKGEVVRASLPDVLVDLGFLWIREGDFDR